jgi:hypothetical protein
MAMKAHPGDKAGTKRRKAIHDPNARILELMQSIGLLCQILSVLLLLSGLCCVGFALLVLVGSHAQSVAGPALAIVAGLIQVVLSRFASGYAHTMDRYLTSGNQIKLVDLFYWQRTICLLFVGLVGAALLAFVVGALILLFSLL